MILENSLKITKGYVLVKWTSLYLMKLYIFKINHTMAKNVKRRSSPGRTKNKLLLNR